MVNTPENCPAGETPLDDLGLCPRCLLAKIMAPTASSQNDSARNLSPPTNPSSAASKPRPRPSPRSTISISSQSTRHPTDSHFKIHKNFQNPTFHILLLQLFLWSKSSPTITSKFVMIRGPLSTTPFSRSNVLRRSESQSGDKFGDRSDIPPQEDEPVHFSFDHILHFHPSRISPHPLLSMI